MLPNNPLLLYESSYRDNLKDNFRKVEGEESSYEDNLKDNFRKVEREIFGVLEQCCITIGDTND